MKKIFYLMAIAISSIFSACNNSGSSSATTSTIDSTADQNLAKDRSIYKAIETGDSATINSLIADDAVDHEGPNGKDVNGGNNIKHMLTDMHNHVKDLKFDILSDAARGDYIFSMVQMHGTANDNSMGAPAGTKMDHKSVDVIKVKDGKMVEHWFFVDPAMMMQRPPANDSTGKMKMK